MGKFFRIIAIVLLVLIVLLVAASQFVSEDAILVQVSETVEQSTGRSFNVDGDKSLSFFPSLSLDLNKVRFANMVNGSRSEMLTVETLTIHIPWLSVLTGELNIDKFVINNPDILLEKSIQGQLNWQFNGASSPEKEAQEQQPASGTTSTIPKGFDVKLGQVEINGGKLTYLDHQTKQSQVIDQLSLAILLPSLNETLSINGSVRYMEQIFELGGEVSTLADVLANKPFKVMLSSQSELVNLNFDGTVSPQGAEVAGSLALAGQSVKKLLAWQNMPLTAKQQAFNVFSLSSNIHFSGVQLNVTDLEMKLDELSFNGQTQLTLAQPIHVQAAIDLGTLNLNPYLPEAITETNTKEVKESSDKQPLVWDDSPIDLSAINDLNTDITITSTQLIFKEIELGKNQLQLQVNNGKATLQLRDFHAYEGKGVGAITINAANKPYRLTSKFNLAGINAEPLLRDASGFDKLLGKGELNWALTTQGLSQKDFIGALNGNFDFSFVDGAIKGFNLAAIAKSAEALLKGDLTKVKLDKDFSNSDKTDFASLTGSFKLTNGKAESSDITLVNPFIRVAGEGSANLPKTEVNFKIKTTLVASATGQSADSDEGGIVIPIKIKGPFHKIKVKPDVSSDVKDKLKDKLKGLFG